MFGESPGSTDFLVALYKSTSGDPTVQVSMYDVGASLGFDKPESGKLAEDLIGNGLVEVKTLSGGIAITPEGVDAALSADNDLNGVGGLNLDAGPILTDAGRQALESLLNEIKVEIGRMTPGYPAMEEMVIDMKTVEVQLLSPNPKTAIVREVLRSLQSALEAAGNGPVANRVKRIVHR